MKKFTFLSLILTVIAMFCLSSAVHAEEILAQGIKNDQYQWILSDYGIYLRTYVGTDYVTEEEVKNEIIRSIGYSENDIKKYGIWRRLRIASNEKKTLTKTITGTLHIDAERKDTISYSLNPKTKTLTIENPKAVQGNVSVFYDEISFYQNLYPYRDYIKNLVIGDDFTAVDLRMEKIGTDQEVQCKQGKVELLYTESIIFDTLTLGKNVSDIQYENTRAYIVDDDNMYYAVYDGCLYSKDYKTLKNIPYEKDVHTISYHPELQILSQSVCEQFGSTDDVFVIPWGVTTIEEGMSKVVYPATVTKIEHLMPYESLDALMPYNCYVREYADNVNGNTLAGENRKYNNIDHPWYQYYGISANSWYTAANGKKYYFRAGIGWKGQEEPVMVTGKQVIDGKEYLFDEYGILQGESAATALNGLIYQDGKAYYYENGVLQKSKWVYADGNWYYLNDYGAGAVNCWRLNGGKYYYLGADGKMKTNSWVKDYGNWYYVKADGSRYESSWAKINGKWYWFGGSGKMAENQWLKLADGKWYYFTTSGAMAANKWVKSGSYWYYLGKDGTMLTNTTTPDGYHVDSEGRWK